MTPKTQGKEEKGPSGLPFINDPGNEDPGSLMDDATVPLMEEDDADIDDETPEYPLPSPTDSLKRDQRPPDEEDVERAPSE